MGKRAILIISAMKAKATQWVGAGACLPLALGLWSCGANEPLVAEAEAVGAHLCAEPSAHLGVTLYGPDQRVIEWSGAQLRCAGMSRPDGEGVRLRFSHAEPSEPLAMVIGLDRVDAGQETPANITLILEDAGRFYSSQRSDNCRARVDLYESIPDDHQAKRLGGLAWCVSPLREVNGDGEMTLGDIEFTGFVPWPPAERASET